MGGKAGRSVKNGSRLERGKYKEERKKKREVSEKMTGDWVEFRRFTFEFLLFHPLSRFSCHGLLKFNRERLPKRERRTATIECRFHQFHKEVSCRTYCQYSFSFVYVLFDFLLDSFLVRLSSFSFPLFPFYLPASVQHLFSLSFKTVKFSCNTLLQHHFKKERLQDF